MKGKKLLISILSVLFILTAVGLGIHFLHKEAFAQDKLHLVWVLSEIDHNAIPGVTVRITVKTGNDDWTFDDVVTDVNGKCSWTVSPAASATFWKAEVTDWNGEVPPVWQDNPLFADYEDLVIWFFTEEEE